jgi:copper chaperone CopZ
MKTIKTLFVIAFAIAITSAAKAQPFNYKLDGPFATTKTFKVNGVCEMCKHRIENAIKDLTGVWSSDWNVDSKTLSVKYDRIKVNPGKIQQIVANAGHDIENHKATDNVYTKLPDCCHYPRKS